MWEVLEGMTERIIMETNIGARAIILNNFIV